MASPQDLSRFETLVDIMVRLRAPDGCPWDREQTHRSIRESLLQECYEVLEAIDEGAADKLCTELGDLLMQIVFHAQIAREAGEFELADVLTSINTKLISRHPHVFGSVKVNTAAEVLHNWEELKKKERGDGTSIIASVPKAMPALAYSQEIQRRVAQVGFDWENLNGVVEKLVEEIKEFKEAGDKKEKEQEFGDLLFTLVNYARRVGIDSESALREASRRFARRFAYMEELCRQRGLDFSKMSMAEIDALWGEAKKKS
ncbi:MAG: nucleoside triphosphate pyrophosphohydrolase [Chloroflexi bacterium]|nr:nucleoside triphosphate pyrophosphohydrolase [Chloroflexota bacterium]